MENKEFRKINSIFFISLILIAFICSLSLISASSQKYTLSVTEEHPFLIDNEWIPASELQVGDLLTTIDGKRARITKITDVVLDSPVNVYNLEAGAYSDFVLENGNVVVHNSNSADDISELISKIDLNNLNQDQKARILSVELELRKSPLSDLEKKTLLGTHKYKENSLIELIDDSYCINYKKGRALRRVFSEQETRIIMEKGYAGRVEIDPVTSEQFYKYTKNKGFRINGLRLWITRHSQGGVSAMKTPDGTRFLTRNEVKILIGETLKKIDRDMINDPQREFVDSKIFVESGVRTKIRWYFEPTQSKSSFCRNVLGGINFHGEFIKL